MPRKERCWPIGDPLREETGVMGCRRHYAAGERRLLSCLGYYLRSPIDEGEASERNRVEQMLLQYIRVKNAFHQLLSHDYGSDGLMRFIENFSRRGFYFGFAKNRKRQRRLLLELERSRMTAALDAQLCYALDDAIQGNATQKPMRGLEMRVSFPENTLALKIIHAWLEGVARHVRPDPISAFFRVSQVGLLFHLIKTPVKTRESHRMAAESANQSARKLGCILRNFPNLRPYIIGFDTAGDERNRPPRNFAGAYWMLRVLQQNYRPQPAEPPIRLGWTYHVGEDFADLLTALRHIDEVYNLLLYPEGGRLGHALALGENPERFYQRRGGQSELCLGAHLLDLVWAHGCLVEEQDNEYIAWLEARIDNLLDQGLERKSNIHGCYIRMGLGGNRSAKHLLENELLNALGFSGCQKTTIAVDANRQWMEICWRLQNRLRRQLARQPICIEANPSSNLLIGGYQHYSQLPYRILVDSKLALSLNTDDPGLFITSLSGEFSAMYAALAEDKTMSHREILCWLNERIFDARQSSFLGNHVPVIKNIPDGLTRPIGGDHVVLRTAFIA